MIEATSSAVEVTFLPDGKTARVPRGTRVNAAAAMAGVFVDAPCGDRGVCGKCRVQVKGELGPPTMSESKYLARKLLDDRWRLGCQATIQGPCTVIVPRSSLQIAVEGLGEDVSLQPNVRKAHVELPEATIAEARSAFTRLRTVLAMPRLRIGTPALRSLAAALATPDGLTATLVGDECVTVEVGDTSASCYGLAFDVGTTTVVGSLVDLKTGEELAVSASLNEQALYGADVISRIKLAIEDPAGVEKLHSQIVRVLNSLIDDLMKQAKVDRAYVYEATIVGNTCMHHLVLGINPASLGQAPYAAVVQDAVAIPAGDLRLNLSPAARVYMLPVIAGHVGADTVGVVLATGLHRADDVRLAVDIGTNGESVLGSRHAMVACSNAAGPAFEGTSIRYGMRATAGAIQGVALDGDVHLSVVGRTAPVGICGSGLIDAVAELRLAGIIDENGRLAGPEDAPQGLSQALLDRLVAVDGERCFRLSPEGGQPVYLTQRDVRELQLAKGAIYAGIQILKRQLGVSDDDIAEIDLAGAFGSYIRPDSAQVIGLIPKVPLERVRSVGNAARVGARLALVSTAARAEAEQIAHRVAHQELFARTEFLDEFMAAMLFPKVE